MTIYIWVDDIRKPHGYKTEQTVWAKTYESAIILLNTFCHNSRFEVVLDPDHDLGTEKSGYDVCKYIVENQLPVAGFHIHSMNPVGVENMRQLLTHYGYKEI